MVTGTWKTKISLAQMLKGGVIMDVVNPEQAKIAEQARRLCCYGTGKSTGRYT